MQMPSLLGAASTSDKSPFEKFKAIFLSMGPEAAYSEAVRQVGFNIGIFQTISNEGINSYSQAVKNLADSKAVEMSEFVKALNAAYPSAYTNLQVAQLQSMIEKAYVYYDEIKVFPVSTGWTLPVSLQNALNISEKQTSEGVPMFAKVALIAGAAYLAYKNFA